MIVAIPIALLAAMTLGALPFWPWSRNWGWPGAGGIGVVLLCVVVLRYFRVL